jgi:hypothetical protein
MALAPIERLPTELIQPVFLLSGANPSLALASHHIAAKLANDYIYHATCTQYLTGPLTARGEDDDQQHSRAEQSQSQTAIFAAKWMTWSFFKAWCTKQYGPDSNGCLCNKTPEEGCFDPIWPPEWEDATKMVFSRSHLPNLAYVKARIPKKLLHNWDQDKIQFLRFLFWTSSMTIDWADEETRQVVQEGKKEAFLTGNLEAVEIFNHNRRLGKTPNLDLVRFAVVEGGCERSIVYDTMLTARMWGVKAEGWNDDVLDKWCEDRIQEGNPKGQWLKTKLAELRKTKEDEDEDKGKAPATTTEGEKPVAPGTLDPTSADYDDVDGDKLVVKQHRWNQVSDILFHFFFSSRGGKCVVPCVSRWSAILAPLPW